MRNINISQHAEVRMQQRGFSRRDIGLLRNYGTQYDHTSQVLTDKAANEAIIELKQEGKHSEAMELQRLRGKCLIIRDNTLVTCFHAKDKQIKSMLKDRG